MCPLGQKVICLLAEALNKASMSGPKEYKKSYSEVYQISSWVSSVNIHSGQADVCKKDLSWSKAAAEELPYHTWYLHTILLSVMASSLILKS